MKGNRLTRAWTVTLLVALLCLPMLVDYFSVLQRMESYELWPVLAVFIGVIFVLRWKRGAPVAGEKRVRRWLLGAMMVFGVALLVFSILYYIPWAAAVAWLVFMAAGALYLSAQREVDNVMGLWLLTLLFLRPPYQLSLRILAWMENISSKTASHILDYGSVIHSVQGNVLALPRHDFLIDSACSGWISMISTVAMAGVIAVLKNRRCVHAAMLLGGAVVISWVVNVLRLLVLPSVMIWFDLDLLSGGYHILYQVGSLLVTLLFLFSADALLSFLLSPGAEEERGEHFPRGRQGLLARIWLWAVTFPLAVVVERVVFSVAKPEDAGMVKTREAAPDPVRRGSGNILTRPVYLLFVAGLIGIMAVEALVLYYRPKVVGQSYMYGESQLSKIGQEAVVFDRPGWQMVSYNEERRDFASIWGALSSTWRLKYNGVNVIMSLDYPFDDWHDVKRCYSKIGWKIADERIASRLPEFRWKASETDLVLPNGDAGFIMCSHCDHLGNTVEPKPVDHTYSMLLYRLHPDRMSAPFGVSMDKDRRTFYQTQCMVATPRPLDETTRQEIRLMYAQFREQIRRAIASRSRQNKNISR